MDGVVVWFPQLVTQRMEPTNGTVSLHVTNCVPEKGFDTGKLMNYYYIFNTFGVLL